MQTEHEIVIRCAHSEMIPIGDLKPHPANPNKHPDGQIALLAKVIVHQGWRAPIVVSKRSGYIVAGHGRLAAAKLLGVEQVPVDYQDFATEADEIAHLLADNRIAELAETDGALLKELLTELDTGAFDMDLTGFDARELERVINSYHVQGENDVNAEWQGMPGFEQVDASGIKCIVHFDTDEALAEFETLLGQTIPKNTKSIWFPEKERESMKDLRT